MQNAIIKAEATSTILLTGTLVPNYLPNLSSLLCIMFRPYIESENAAILYGDPKLYGRVYKAREEKVHSKPYLERLLDNKLSPYL